MSGVETYGSQCPHCQSPMLQKWDSCSHALQYDACPHCGFAYGVAANPDFIVATCHPVDLWESVFSHYCVDSLAMLREKIKDWEPSRARDTCVFDYSDLTPEGRQFYRAAVFLNDARFTVSEPDSY